MAEIIKNLNGFGFLRRKIELVESNITPWQEVYDSLAVK